MKRIFTLVMLALLVILDQKAVAQATYTISSNTSWAGVPYPSYCNTCTFNISSGNTLSIDLKNITCSSCTFNGGNISITKDFTCQSCSFNADSISMKNVTLNLQSSTTSFSNVVFDISGNGAINATSPVNITNSIFTFTNNAYFLNNGGTLNLTNSTMYFYKSAYFIANAGPVNLKSNSKLVAGDGTASSTAYIKINGPQLNEYDNSFIALANTNNYYFNWSSYHSAVTGANYSTSTNTMNCGGTGQNSCSAPNVYGPASLTTSGLVSGNILPVVLTDFKAAFNNNAVAISWSTQQEQNSAYFTVERSADGSNWDVIGNVQAKGNSSVISNYSFADIAPFNGNNYYRLLMVDLDGKQAVSDIAHVSVAVTAQTATSIYPNPVTNLAFNLRVGSTDPVVVKIFSAEGRMVGIMSLRNQLQYHVELPASIGHNNYLIVQIVKGNKAETLSLFNK
ncbi:MAG TPA: hypothetical protein VMT76_07665 [Puia sp.]|nr:hypothetical protein [Puia sp.]